METNPRRTQIERQPLDRRQLLRHHQDQARLAELERVLGDCIRYIDGTWGAEDDLPEPPCSIEAKQLLGWRLA